MKSSKIEAKVSGKYVYLHIHTDLDICIDDIGCFLEDHRIKVGVRYILKKGDTQIFKIEKHLSPKTLELLLKQLHAIGGLIWDGEKAQKKKERKAQKASESVQRVLNIPTIIRGFSGNLIDGYDLIFK
jgi:hypothetical protein